MTVPAATAPLHARRCACRSGGLPAAARGASRRRAGLAQLAGGDPGVRVPGFWDPRRRPERPDLSRLTVHALPHRGRLSAVQFCRSGRTSAGLQRRSRAGDVRGAQARLHDPDAPFRDAGSRAQCQPGRRGDRLDRGDAPTCAARSISPILIIARRHASWPSANLRSTIRCRRSSKARRSRSSPAPRTRPISRPCSPRSKRAPIRAPTWRGSRCARAMSISCSVTPSRWRSGSTAPIRRIAAAFAAAPTWTAAISAKASASR